MKIAPISIVTYLALHSGLALATDTILDTDSTNSTLDTIIVSAARTPISVRESGSSVTLISRAEIERRESRHVADLLRTVPGFAVSHTGVIGSQTQIRVRGAEANHILVLIDGVRANDPATGDEFRWEYLGTNNIERIEIIRGPQSALWGSDAVAAVVHIITKNGDNNATGANLYLEGGSNETTNGGLSASFGDTRWSLAASLEHFDTAGENISRFGDEDDGADLSTFSLSGRVNINSAISVRAGIRAVDAYSQFDPVDFTTSLPSDGDVSTDAKTLSSHIGAQFDGGDGRVRHSISVRNFDSDNRNAADGIENSSTKAGRRTFAYQSDIGINGNMLSLALEHEVTEFEQRGLASVFGDPNQDQEIDSSAVVAEYQYRDGERFGWILSARFDDNSDFDNAFNGRLSTSYKVNEMTSLRGSVGTARKNPTFVERFGFFAGTFIGNTSLKPEQSLSLDIGLDHSILDGRGAVQLSVFRQDLRNEINGFVFDAGSGMFTADNVDGESERSGAEVALELHIGDSIRVGGHYTYTDAREDNTAGVVTAELRRPRHSGGVSLDYAAAEDRLTFAVNAGYGGRRNDIFFDPTTFASQTVALDSYWLVDLTVRFDLTDAVTLFARTNNLLDESYEQVLGYQTPGSTSYIGARVNFGQR